MAVNEGRFAENLRRAAGAHLVSLDALAKHIGLSRPAIMKLVAHKGQHRSLPSGSTALRLAGAFGVEVRDLYEEPSQALRAVVDAFERAPIRSSADVPESVLTKPRHNNHVDAAAPHTLGTHLQVVRGEGGDDGGQGQF